MFLELSGGDYVGEVSGAEKEGCRIFAERCFVRLGGASGEAATHLS